MRIKHILATLGLTAVMGVGVAVGLNSSKAVEAKADGNQSIYVRLDPTSWGSASAAYTIHYWGSVSGWSKMSQVSTENLADLYKAEIPSTATGMIVLRYNPDEGDGESWGGEYNRSGDVDLTVSRHNLFLNTGWNSSYSWASYDYVESAYTFKVLDASHDLLSTTYNAHVWQNDGTSDVDNPCATVWPGRSMKSEGGNVYSVTTGFKDLNRVVFNAKTNSGDSTHGQSVNISIDYSADLFVLTDVEDGNWTGGWVSNEASEFIETYLKFDTIDPITKTKGTDCKSGWDALFTAYTTTYASVQAEIISVPEAKARLAAWAEANGASFNASTGALSSVRVIPNEIASNETNNTAIIVAIVAGAALLAIGGYFVIRRRKED